MLIVVGLVVGAWQYSTLLKIMLRRVREGHAAEMGDLNLGLQGIGGFIAAMLVLGLLIGIGFVFLIIPGLILMTIWAYALVLVADKGSGIGEAMSESSALAKRPGYLMTFVTLLVGGIVVGVISALLNMIPVIGQIISLFIGVYMVAYLVAMYFQATGETAPARPRPVRRAAAGRDAGRRRHAGGAARRRCPARATRRRPRRRWAAAPRPPRHRPLRRLRLRHRLPRPRRLPTRLRRPRRHPRTSGRPQPIRWLSQSRRQGSSPPRRASRPRSRKRPPPRRSTKLRPPTKERHPRDGLITARPAAPAAGRAVARKEHTVWPDPPSTGTTSQGAASR